MKKRGILKTLTTLGLSGILAFGAGIFSGCNNTPDSQPDPKPNPQPDPKPDSKPNHSVKLDEAKTEFNSLVSEIATAKSLTATRKSGQEMIKIEIADGLLKQTENNVSSYVETTTDGNSFEYTLQEDGYHKKAYTGSLTASATQDMIVAMMNNVTWTAVDENGKLSGTQAEQQVESTYVATGDDKSITFTTDTYTITIDNINNTKVTRPEVTVDETQKQEEFKVEENIELLMKNLQSSLELLVGRVNRDTALTEVKNIYLTKSTNSKYVDSIGATYVAETTNGSEYLYVAQLRIPTQEDLTYQNICEKGLQYDRYDVNHKKLFDFNISKERQAEIKNCIDILAPFAFGDDYQEKADWFGLYGGSGAGVDTYRLVMLSGKTITKIGYGVYSNNATSMYDALIKNFVGKEASDINTTWKQTVNEVYELPEDILNLSELMQENNKDYEQNR